MVDRSSSDDHGGKYRNVLLESDIVEYVCRVNVRFIYQYHRWNLTILSCIFVLCVDIQRSKLKPLTSVTTVLLKSV